MIGIQCRTMKHRFQFLSLLFTVSLVVFWVNPVIGYDRRTPIVEAVDKVLPAVVNISTTKNVTVDTSPFPFRFRSPFDDFFEKSYDLHGLGSGVVVEGGYVVTNNHVIAYDFGPADKIFITFYNDNDSKEATIIGSDPVADIAILRIQGEPPNHYLPWGRSDDLMIGETVIAVGNAVGQPFTVTNGIISALHRSIADDEGRKLYNLIQTNSDINRGNSGGPLVNINGDFIGLNTAILSPSGGSIGVGFAIPVSRVKKVYDYWVNNILSLEDLMGLEVHDLSSSLERFFRDTYPSLEDEDIEGIVVVEVSPQGLCADVLKSRDILYQIDGKPIQNSEEFLSLLEEHRGNQLTFGVIREGEREELTINVPKREIERITWLGMELQELDAPWKRRYKLSDKYYGLVVLSVQPESPAANANIQRGDLITSINKHELEKLSDLEEVADSLRPSQTFVLDIFRRIDTGWEHYLLRMKNTQML